MPAHVDHREGGDLVAQPFLVDVALFVADGGIGDLLHLTLGQRAGRVGHVVPPARVLLEVLVVAPAVGVPCFKLTFFEIFGFRSFLRW